MKKKVSKSSSFTKAFNKFSKDVYQNARDKGFYDKSHDDGTRIALIHSEASEALEALRLGNPPDDKVPAFSGAEAELADVVIRCMDFATAKGWRLAEAIEAKHTFNKTRPKMHGKKLF